MGNRQSGILAIIISAITLLMACSKDTAAPVAPVNPPNTENFSFADLKVNDTYTGFNYVGISNDPTVRISFTAALDKTTAANAVNIKNQAGVDIPFDLSFEDDQTMIIKPKNNLQSLSKYVLNTSTVLKSAKGKNLGSNLTVNLLTAVDETDKFSRISDDALLELVQKQTFNYFWAFGHPVSGMARERNTAGNTVTTGGTGFGVMAMVAAVHRNFITRTEAVDRIQNILNFLKTADRFHGAFSHWIDGNTGKTIAFSAKDNGGDLVETSLLMQGLIASRQYFNGANAAETALRNDINQLYQSVEWSWYRKNNTENLYWHWSRNFGWDMNMPIKGWNEALITYVLAAGSTDYSIPKSVYDNGWAANGAMRNGNNYYGQQLPFGPVNGGPLFFSHYSFLGINPFGLKDAYGDYEQQVKAHTLMQFNYAKANPKNFYGYGENVWGLTASDDINGYLAHEINNDNGVISPTAALSSFPYTPAESMLALKYFYYKLGDKTWGEYGFTDAFSMKDAWFSNSALAIDQGPIIVMIENHRSKLLWNLFMSAPETKAGMQKLGFTSPNL